ncbi:phasin family protein [Shewanella sp. SNU WT4]|uniref:phasin family protein n=1 Tax=Shewanella sp. SNU WT4 TaxID=2590015 RepID=UPI00112B7696|nr:phasin family protein [Shewanella sp. SNU WT4]QDF67392.1 phasin family protein [Shewanella sp. SNU WT4]
MYTDMFKMFSDQTEQTLAPFNRFNLLLADHVEQVTKLQMNAMQAYTELGLTQLKAASNVKDVTSLMAFNTQQMSVLNKLSKQLQDDSNQTQAIAKEFKQEFDSLVSANVKKATGA